MFNINEYPVLLNGAKSETLMYVTQGRLYIREYTQKDGMSDRQNRKHN